MITRDKICCCAVSIIEFDGSGGGGSGSGGGTDCWAVFLFKLVRFRALVAVVA